MSETSIWNNPPVGFRMMAWDPFAFALCGAAVWWGWAYVGAWTLIMPYVLGTFFLFCNVFRVRRNSELFWAATFLVNALAWLQLHPSLLGIVAIQTPITIAVIGVEMRSERYHGVGAAR